MDKLISEIADDEKVARILFLFQKHRNCPL